MNPSAKIVIGVKAFSCLLLAMKKASRAMITKIAIDKKCKIVKRS
jgi:hypothetical protein